MQLLILGTVESGDSGVSSNHFVRSHFEWKSYRPSKKYIYTPKTRNISFQLPHLYA